MEKVFEALDWLLANEMIYRGRTQLPISPALRDIKQTLIEAKADKQVLDLIIEKNVDILNLKLSKNALDYNFGIIFEHREDLTQAEFEAIKRRCGKK